MNSQQPSFFGSPAPEADPWCDYSHDPTWDGVDLSPCFRRKVLNGYLPLVFLSLSLLATLLAILISLLTRQIPAVALPLSTSSARRLSTASRRGRSASVSSAEIKSEGPMAIAEAENEVILGVVHDESPDLEISELLDMGVGAKHGKRDREDGLLAPPSPIEEEDEDHEVEEQKRSTIVLLFRALWGTKKDMFNLVGAAVIVGLLVDEFVSSLDVDGAHWTTAMIAAWSWTTLLTLIKLVISCTGKLRRLESPSTPHRLSSLYLALEIHIIPWYFVYSLIEFMNFRSAILDYASASKDVDPTSLVRETAIFTTAILLLLIEMFAPRPSRFSSRSSKKNKSSTGDELPQAPEMNASLFSIATFSYLDTFMLRAAFPSSKYPPLTMKTVPDLRPDDKTARVLLAFRRDVARLNSGREASGKKPWGLTVRLFWHFRWMLLGQQGWSYLRVATIGIPPLLLKELLAHISKRSRGEEAPMHVAIFYAAAMFLAQVIASLAASQALFIGRRVCIRLRSIVIGEVFTKALRRKDLAGSSAADEKVDDEKKEATEEELEKASSGKIINLISVDTFRLSEICAYLHFVWPELFLTIIITIALLFRVLGLSAVAGLTVLVAITPLQAYASKLFYVYQKKLLAAADARLNLATEVISSVRIVKYFAWEEKFLEMMAVTRAKELDALWQRAITMVYSGVLTFGAPVIVAVATFVFHTKYLGLDLDAETAFTALALFNILRGPLEGFTDMLINVLQAHVSLKRIDEFLNEQETAKYSTIHKPTGSSDPIVGMVDGTFTWSDEQTALDDPSVFRIKDLNLNFPVGKLSIILGPVGSGKTTVLLSLLGETNKLSGASFLPSPVVRSTGADPKVLCNITAYCSQSPWLRSETVRENILFGSAYNEARYREVLDACALEQDLKQFELGDETEVGEKGTVLSGGQKARIGLARAIYSRAKHILLDDVLSAVDSHTAQHLFAKCLTGRLMRHRTCVLVTHAVDLCLPGSSYVVSMDNGVVVACGAPDQISLSSSRLDSAVASKQAEIEAMASTITIEAIAEGKTDVVLDAEALKEKKARMDKLKLVKDETQSEGSVNSQVYLLYLRAMGGWWLAAGSMIIFIAAQFSEIGVSLALRYWAGSYDDRQAPTPFVASTLYASFQHWRSTPSTLGTHSSFLTFGTGNATTDYWLKLYCILAAVNVSLYGLRVAFFLHRGVAASRIIYIRLIDSILGAPIRFFDSTPTGRILNRLSKDMETIDQDVAVVGMYFILEVLGVIGIIGTISAVLPSFLIAAVFIVLIYWGIGYIYISSSRELKRSESVTKSPIFGLFGETLNGVATIRAYGDSARFTKQIFSLLNINNRPFFALWQGNRWLSVRIDVAGAGVTFAASIFVLLKSDMDAALAGFILSFAIAFNERILWVVRLWSIVEIDFNSVERVREYLELEQESQVGISPPAIWPSRDGSIEVEGLTATYSVDLPPVLKGVTFKILPREKVGICGRTGSGKSTLGLSFFRFIEPTSGRIVIDGIDINTLKLNDLRRRLTIVAQESALFAGTLRFNLDPFEAYEDKDIWDALRRVQMASPLTTPGVTPKPSRAPSRTASLKGDDQSEGTATEGESERYVVKTLEMAVQEGGKNFSQGQRQLLALARGILKLRTSSILILDESTASLDHATDERIQATIREEMSDATILCIAHRLRTIIDYDKILVLGEGEVLEYDSPWALLEKEDSSFSQLCHKSGEYEELLALAQAARDRKQQV